MITSGRFNERALRMAATSAADNPASSSRVTRSQGARLSTAEQHATGRLGVTLEGSASLPASGDVSGIANAPAPAGQRPLNTARTHQERLRSEQRIDRLTPTEALGSVRPTITRSAAARKRRPLQRAVRRLNAHAPVLSAYRARRTRPGQLWDHRRRPRTRRQRSPRRRGHPPFYPESPRLQRPCRSGLAPHLQKGEHDGLDIARRVPEEDANRAPPGCAKDSMTDVLGCSLLVPLDAPHERR